jgi:hypothetical protein
LTKNKLPHTVPGYVSFSFFLLGIVSAIAFRIIIVFQRIEPEWVRPVWYIGVLGYIGFFMYRYAIARKRKNVIKDFELIEKVGATPAFRRRREVVTYLSFIIKNP